MRFLKVTLIIILSIILIAGAAVYVLFTKYKKEIAEELKNKLHSTYGINLEIEQLQVSFFSNWPQAAIKMKNVTASGNKFPGSEFKAGSVSLSLNVRELIRKNLLIQSLLIKDGDITFVKRDDTIKVAEKIPAFEQEPEDELRFEIKKIQLKNTHFSYNAAERGQDFDMVFADGTFRFDDFADGVAAKINGKVSVNHLVFRKNKGSFLDSTSVKLDLQLNYFKDTRSFCIRPGSGAQIEGQYYGICANIQLGEEKSIAVVAQTKEVLLNQVRRIVNDKIRHVLRNYDVSGPMHAKAILVAGIGTGEEPVVIISAQSQRNKVNIGTSRIPYRDIAFSGKIVSIHPSMKHGDIKKARVTFDRVTGLIYNFPFSASVKVRNLNNPFITINGKMNIDAAMIDFQVKNDFDLRGKANAYISYSGLARHINRKQFLGNDMKLVADLQLINLSYREKSRPYVYTLNGMSRVNRTDITFDSLSLATAVGNASLKGKVDGFVKYLLGYSKGFKATLIARSDSLNLNTVLVKERQVQDKADKLASSQAAAKYNQTSSIKRDPADTSSKIQKTRAFVEKKDSSSAFEFDVELLARKLYMRRVLAEDAKIKMHYKEEALDLRSFKLYACDGKISGSGRIEHFNKIDANLSVEDVDVNKLFAQFENFGQEAVVSENLQGKIHLQAKFSSMLDEQMEVIGETMSGEVRLSLKDGKLVNFEPLQKLSNFVFKNRDFANVTFTELNETFQVRGFEMKINELEIGSNILNLFVVDGIYNFRGLSNINLLVPWSNLKKRGKDYVPTLSGKSASETKGIKVNFSGPPNNMKISLGHKELSELKPSI